MSNKPFVCQYCGHGYTKEKTLMVHVCEQKRRALAKTERHVVLGFDAFNRFFKMSQNLKGEKTYADFCKSPYYNAFVKFGSFVSNVNPLYPDRFIDYVIRSGVKLDHWCRDELYDSYVVDLIKTESDSLIFCEVDSLKTIQGICILIKSNLASFLIRRISDWRNPLSLCNILVSITIFILCF